MSIYSSYDDEMRKEPAGRFAGCAIEEIDYSWDIHGRCLSGSLHTKVPKLPVLSDIRINKRFSSRSGVIRAGFEMER